MHLTVTSKQIIASLLQVNDAVVITCEKGSKRVALTSSKKWEQHKRTH